MRRSPADPSAERAGFLDFCGSIAICGIILIAFLFTSTEFDHWFIVPVYISGVLISADGIRWFRSRPFTLVDPVGIIGVLGFHFFFLAPLLHVHWDYWMRYVAAPDDWRPWLGWMAWINLAGLIVYRAAVARVTYRPVKHKAHNSWVLNEKRFLQLSIVAMVLTALLQLYVYRTYGGVVAYMTVATDLADQYAMRGMGWLFLLSESFPTIAMMAFVVHARRHPRRYSSVAIALMLLVYLMLLLFFGGLRGSRSNTVWGLFTGVAYIHLWVQPITRRMLIAGMCFLVLFLYAYGFYKGAGIEGLKAVPHSDTRAELADETGRTWQSAILGDLGRSDVQAFVLYRLMKEDRDYDYAYGRTYVGAAAMLIPRQIWPERPPNKVKEGTDALYGQGAYIPETRVASRVYGLAGETILNFGPYVVFLAFGAWGVVVGVINRFTRLWNLNDARYLMVPVLLNFSFLMLISDSDNLTFFMLKRSIVPLGLIFLSAVRIPAKVCLDSPTDTINTLRVASTAQTTRIEMA